MDEAKLEKLADNLVLLMRVFRIMLAGSEGHGPKIMPLDPQYWVLGILQRGDLPMSELGRRLHRSKPNMTAVVNSLIADGRVARRPDKSDRRIVRISITPKGRAFLKGAKMAVKANMKRNLSRLSSGDLDTLYSSLEEVNRVIGKASGGLHGT